MTTLPRSRLGSEERGDSGEKEAEGRGEQRGWRGWRKRGCSQSALTGRFHRVTSFSSTAVSSEAWSKLREWAVLAG